MTLWYCKWSKEDGGKDYNFAALFCLFWVHASYVTKYIKYLKVQL